jgi:UDP-N-acetylmuramoyl-L-alanyl-D-glutamate--2,6-diaminopimelate ligase
VFYIDGEQFEVPLVGEFNVLNVAAAICVSLSQGLQLQKIKESLKKIKPMLGRLETVDAGQPFPVIVDYAHEPASLEAVYKTLKIFNPKRIIAVLGAQGGGRDKWKRPKLGEIAARYCQEVIITNEDPYDENPEKIIEEVAAGVKGVNLYKILDRRGAIKKALTLARPNDLVIITGKGCEQYIMGPNNKKIAWDDREVVREEIGKLGK